MSGTRLLRFKTITDFHRIRNLPEPEHPLISVIDVSGMTEMNIPPDQPRNLVFDFYSISLKKNLPFKMKYGRQEYDFDEGVMSFQAPGQVFGIEPAPRKELEQSGWMLLVHPDFLWNTPLAKTIKSYEYFGYSVHEALFLSPKEEATITEIIRNIEREYHANIDTFSQDIIIAQMELLLTYAQRFYSRQFITRKISNHRILERLEELLTEYFDGDAPARQGLLSVQYIADALAISPNYLSSLLKALTGRSTQQHIQDRLIEKAKADLSTTDLTVSEIAFKLGFEHSQSFSKLFKKKTDLSPMEFRHSFN
jgi:AraC family transcriptional regulator, transcriptional activator of pobA